MRSDQPEAPSPHPLSRREFAGGLAASALVAGSLRAEPSAVTEAPPRPAAAGPLADYVQARDPATRFTLVCRGELMGGEFLRGRLVSQRWRGVEWAHELSLFRPAARAADGPMLLWIDGGSSGGVPADDSRGPGDATRILAQVATAAGLPAAVVRQVPFQPMFAGLVEDGLIAHTFVEFVKTGDTTLPLLLPIRALARVLVVGEPSTSAATAPESAAAVAAASGALIFRARSSLARSSDARSCSSRGSGGRASSSSTSSAAAASDEDPVKL